MKLFFKQRIFSWLDSYDIYDEEGVPVYTVEGQFSWGHRLHISDAVGEHIATVQQQLLTFFPKFELSIGERCLGCITKEFSFFSPRFTLEFNGWQVNGEFMEWDYAITAPDGTRVATISKEPLHWADTYAIDVADPRDALCALMVVLAIDAEKCSRN